MRLAGMRLRQRDGVSCGPAVAVVARAMLEPAHRLAGTGPADLAWFAAEQARVHGRVNLLWPRALGTTPMGMVAAIGAGYHWRLWRGLWRRRDPLDDVLAAVRAGKPVPMLVGRVIPRHWVLIVDVERDELRCYEPSSGDVRRVTAADVRSARLTGLGYPWAFAFVLPPRGLPKG
ncbi:hypothetical protein [Mycolicibacterium lacusdiani]|uniref:hypothetical protein n=1 Tax=Mycolicibacterium lacusdiani TaxID=2895283 RepID=UPI001F2CC466|nr:hypothetical protein [Mycolicibacterium lacusdiani]